MVTGSCSPLLILADDLATLDSDSSTGLDWTWACPSGQSLGSRPPRPSHHRSLELLLVTTQFRQFEGRCGALEVHPVALRPVIAGIRRRDHLGLRRVFRDGVGSDRHGRGTRLALPKVGASSAAPRRRFRLRSACGPRGRSVSRRVSAWARSRPSGLPLLGFSKVFNRAPRFRLSAARTIASPSRGSRVASLVAASSVLLAPVSGSHSIRSCHRTLGSPLHRHQRHAAAFSDARWPPLVPSSYHPAALPREYAQLSSPGAADANLLTPASRPRRLSRPRRCHHIWSSVPRRVLVLPGRRVSVTSLPLVSARAPRLSPVRAGVSSRPRLATLLATDPEVNGSCAAADHRVH